MRPFIWIGISLVAVCGTGSAQNTFAITGTPIPADLLQQNYGKLPKGIAAYDLNVCNISGSKQSLVSSEIYQAVAQSTAGLQPIGKQIMLAAILRNQNRSSSTMLTVALNSVTGILSILSSSKYSPPPGVITGAALGAMSAQQLLANLKPVLSSDQVEKFEAEVLESALVLDGGSCVERTMFAAAADSTAKAHNFEFPRSLGGLLTRVGALHRDDEWAFAVPGEQSLAKVGERCEVWQRSAGASPRAGDAPVSLSNRTACGKHG